MGLGENIKKHRKQKNLSRKQLGELIGRSEYSIKKYELEEVTPSLSIIKDISHALDVSSFDLVPGGEEARNELIEAQKRINNLQKDPLVNYLDRYYEDIEEDSFKSFYNYIETTYYSKFPELFDDTSICELLPADLKELYIKVNEFVEFNLIKTKDKKTEGF